MFQIIFSLKLVSEEKTNLSPDKKIFIFFQLNDFLKIVFIKTFLEFWLEDFKYVIKTNFSKILLNI